MRCAVYTRQSVRRAGDDPAITSCAIQRTLCTEFIRNKTWQFWYPIAERFDDEGESGATLERPGLAKLLQRIEEGDVHRVIVYRVDRLTRKLADLSRLAAFFERQRVGLTIVAGNIGFSLPAGQKRERERRPARPGRTPAALSARTPSRRTQRSPTRKPSGKQGRKGNGPEDRSSGPLLTWCSRQVRDEREMAPRSGGWTNRFYRRAGGCST